MRFLADHDDARCGDGRARLYRQAVALGLDREDPLVRGILVHKMRLLLNHERVATPDDATSARISRRMRIAIASPRGSSRITSTSPAWCADETAELVARTLRDRLETQHVAAADAVRLGDPFPAGGCLRAQSARELSRLFGPDFAKAVMVLAPRTWSGPIHSAYGMHLVWVDDKTGPGWPSVDAVRSRVAAQWSEERQMTPGDPHARATRQVRRARRNRAGDRG